MTRDIYEAHASKAALMKDSRMCVTMQSTQDKRDASQRDGFHKGVNGSICLRQGCQTH